MNELERAREANAAGDRERNVYGDQTLTAAASKVSATFTVWTFADGTWSSHQSLVADQPPDGFTVYTGEPEEQVAILRRTWERGDPETRRLTQAFAEMSVTRPKSGR